jgi:hypothetical protein
MPRDSRPARANAFRCVQNNELRPLGAGELLDRAVTLFVRRFVPIVIVLAITIVPLFVLQAIATPESAHVVSDMGRILAAAGTAGTTRDPTADLEKLNAGLLPQLVFVLVAMLARLLMWSAIVYVIAAAYATGASPSVGDAYKVGANCWPAQLLVGIVFSVLGSICLMPLMLLYIAILAGIFALAFLHVNTAITVTFVILGIVVLFAAFAIVGSFVYMTYELATVYIVTESPNAVAAITAAIRRTVSRATWWRTVVAGLVVLAITQGGLLPLLFLAGLLVAVTHIDGLYFAIFGTGTILLDGLVAAFVVVYATDMRVRREGLDLVALTQAQPAQPLPG